MSIGNVILKRRKELGLTQEKLAEVVGVSFQTISNWERGDFVPEYENMKKVADALAIKIAALYEEDSRQFSVGFNDRIFDEEHMYTYVKAIAKDLPQTWNALPFMKEAHAGQVRRGKEKVPYINHPLTMACQAFALEIEKDNPEHRDDIMAAILLHDVVEDTEFAAEDLPVNDNVKEVVRLLTRIKGQKKSDYYAEIAENRDAILIKVLDRCSNISLMATGMSTERIHKYIEETEEYIMPLLDLMKKKYPEFYNAAFLLKYQMRSIIETVKRML